MIRVILSAAFATAWTVASAHAQDGARRANRTSCEAKPAADRVVSVTEHGELRLASGGLAKLSGIRLATDPGERGRALARLRASAGLEAQTAALGTSVDRWGRTPAIVVISREGGATDLARDLVASGLALVDGGEADQLCRSDLLGFERGARDSGLGLWGADPDRVVSAEDLVRLRQRIGGFAVVEGRIRSVGERSRRTYLNFGRDWADDFTVTIPQPAWDTMRHRGMTAGTLRGRRIRVRGIVEDWRGPAITLGSADLLEILEGEASTRR